MPTPRRHFTVRCNCLLGGWHAIDKSDKLPRDTGRALLNEGLQQLNRCWVTPLLKPCVGLCSENRGLIRINVEFRSLAPNRSHEVLPATLIHSDPLEQRRRHKLRESINGLMLENSEPIGLPLRHGRKGRNVIAMPLPLLPEPCDEPHVPPNARAYRRAAGWRDLCLAKGVTDQTRPSTARG